MATPGIKTRTRSTERKRKICQKGETGLRRVRGGGDDSGPYEKDRDYVTRSSSACHVLRDQHVTYFAHVTLARSTSTTMANVHWALDVSVSEFGSAFDTTSSSCTSTSSLQYINSQLVAHGFTPSPGISLDGVSNENMERVTKCLLAMLSQRVVCQPAPIRVYCSTRARPTCRGQRNCQRSFGLCRTTMSDSWACIALPSKQHSMQNVKRACTSRVLRE